jgi:hypothetical protein
MGQRLTPALGTSVSSAVTEPVRTVTADPIDHIHEIFFYVRKLLVEDNRRAEDFVDWQVLEAAVLEEEPLPLFIRDGEHLRRWA